MSTEMSLFCVNESAARTKQTARSELVTMNDVVNRMRQQIYSSVEQAAGSAAAGANLDSSINALLSLHAYADVIMESDKSDSEDSTTLLRENIAKLLARDTEKSDKKNLHEEGLKTDEDTLAQLMGRKKLIKGSTHTDSDELIESLKERIALFKSKIKGYKY